MPYIICTNNHPTKYRNTKGAHAPTMCPTCGAATMRGRLALDPQRHVEPVPPRPASTQMTECPICGRRRRVPSASVKRFAADTLVRSNWGIHAHGILAPADTWICWHHTEWKEESA